MGKLSKLMIEGSEIIDKTISIDLFCNFNLKHLSLTEITIVEGFENIAKNTNLYGLTCLDMSISQSTIESIEILTNSPIFTNLTCLIMEHNHINDEMIKILTKCNKLSQLKKLNLFANDIENVGLLHISNCKYLSQLTFLNLRRNCFNDKGVEYLSNSIHMKNIEYLDISRNQLSDESVISISNSLYLTNITSIDLTSNNVGHSCVDHLFKLKHLKIVKFCSNDLNEQSMEIISNQCINNLTILDLGYNPIKEGASHLFNSCNSSNLTQLDLTMCQLPIKCIVDLSMSDSMINLKKLHLGFNKIGNEGLMLIVTSLYNLTHLHIPHCGISSKGVKYLCEGSLYKLVFLDLVKNEIDSEGLQYISKSNNLLYLEYLYLDRNLISDLSELLISKENLQNLKCISMRKCLISTIIGEKIEKNQLLTNLEFLNLSKNNIERSELSKFFKMKPIRLEVWHDYKSLKDL